MATIRRHKVLILLVMVLGAAIGLGYSAIQKKSYSATASMQVSDPNQELTLLDGSYLSQNTPLQLASAAAPQVTRQEILLGVKSALNSSLTTTQLQNAVSATIDPNSYLIDITSSAANPNDAARIANAFADVDSTVTNSETRAQFASQAKSLSRQLKSQLRLHTPAADLQATQTQETLNRVQSLASVATPLSISAAAAVPTSPSSPKPTRNTIAGLLIGLFLGIGLAIGRDALDRRLRHASDVSAVINEPIVGFIRSSALGHAGMGAREPGTRLTLSDVDEESFRILRHNVRFLSADMNTVLVTSPMAEEGKSTVAACLACALAESGTRTLLVECDMRRPVLAERFGIAQAPGLADYLTGNADPSQILQATPIGVGRQSFNGNGAAAELGDPVDLVCITAGSAVPRPAELLASERFGKFLREVGEVYDVVVLDTAPLLPVADTLGIIPEVSTVLLCVRLGQTTRDQARAAKAALDRLPDRPIGLVLTDVREQEEGYYGYYGYARAGGAEASPAHRA